MRRSFTLALAVVLPACTDAGGTASTTLVRDSAGIEIVESSAPTWSDGEAWMVADQATLDIGTLNGPAEYQLYQVRGAVELEDGRIVIANGGTHELRFYGAAGEHLMTVGGEGGGPGEFQRIDWIGTMPGENPIVVWDGRARRLSRFRSDGSFADSETLNGFDAFFTVPLVGVFADGSAVIRDGREISDMRGTSEGVLREPRHFVRATPAAATIDTIATAPGNEILFYDTGEQWGGSGLIFGRETFAAVGSSLLFVGDNEQYGIRAYTRSGDLAQIVRRRWEPIEAGQDGIGASRQERIDRYNTVSNPSDFIEESKERIRNVPARETLPAFADLKVDTSGNLWVERSRLPGDEQPVWDVFDSDGLWLGPVQTPPDLRIMQIGSDYVLGVWNDEFDVQHLLRHEVEKP